jgi:hypothetical protein
MDIDLTNRSEYKLIELVEMYIQLYIKNEDNHTRKVKWYI